MKENFTCIVSGKQGNSSNMVAISLLSRKVHMTLKRKGVISDSSAYVHVETINELMAANNHPLTVDEQEQHFEKELSFGDRMADKIADFGGSWTFILMFLGFIALWICVNVIQVFHIGFDEYPFILLNLILSCVAAIQAPIIMMSQNRQESKDRMRAENDYHVNLKAEEEIRDLQHKIDYLIALSKKVD